MKRRSLKVNPQRDDNCPVCGAELVSSYFNRGQVETTGSLKCQQEVHFVSCQDGKILYWEEEKEAGRVLFQERP